MTRPRVPDKSRGTLFLNLLHVPRGLAALLLGCLLVLVQTLGLLHGALHAPVAVSTSVHLPAAGMQAQAAPHAAIAVSSSGDFLAQLFSGHQNSSDCRLYDVLSHGDLATSMPAMLLPLPLPVFVPWVETYAFCARQVALFEARGPPLSR